MEKMNIMFNKVINIVALVICCSCTSFETKDQKSNVSGTKEEVNTTDFCSRLSKTQTHNTREISFASAYKNGLEFRYMKLEDSVVETNESFAKSGNKDLVVSYFSSEPPFFIQIYSTKIPPQFKKDMDDFGFTQYEVNDFARQLTKNGELISKDVVRINDLKFIYIDHYNFDIFNNKQRSVNWITFINGSMINISGTALPEDFLENLPMFQEFACSVFIREY